MQLRVFNAVESAYRTTCKSQTLLSQSQNVQTFIINNPNENQCHNPATTGISPRTEKRMKAKLKCSPLLVEQLKAHPLPSARLARTGAGQGSGHREDEQDCGGALSEIKHRTYQEKYFFTQHTTKQ